MTYQFISEHKLKRKAKIETPEEVYKLVKRYAGARQEHFILLTLNGAHDVVSISIISIGLVNKTIVHPREVYIKAICDNAVAIIVCHNHPSGETYPSDEDRLITLELYNAGKIIGIPLIDHIIFTKSNYASLKGMGFIPSEELFT